MRQSNTKRTRVTISPPGPYVGYMSTERRQTPVIAFGIAGTGRDWASPLNIQEEAKEHICTEKAKKQKHYQRSEIRCGKPLHILDCASLARVQYKTALSSSRSPFEKFCRGDIHTPHPLIPPQVCGMRRKAGGRRDWIFPTLPVHTANDRIAISGS